MGDPIPHDGTLADRVPLWLWVLLTMKGLPFHKRCIYACQGILSAFRNEASFRIELLLGAMALLFTAWLSPPLLWVALVVIMVALVLGAELLNTALEQVLDGLHPDRAEFVQVAKDCAAAAVLVFSVASVVVLVLMLMDVSTH